MFHFILHQLQYDMCLICFYFELNLFYKERKRTRIVLMKYKMKYKKWDRWFVFLTNVLLSMAHVHKCVILYYILFQLLLLNKSDTMCTTNSYNIFITVELTYFY